MKHRSRQIQAAALALVLTAGGVFSQEAAAGPAQVRVDEAMYVNLDCYGQLDQVNVVKSCSLNGIQSFTDYGSYLSVENMTTLDQPLVEEGKVEWNLSEIPANGRFYYKGALDAKQIQLPWTFDISYKLNGVPVNGPDLAGAGGLVEIQIQAFPNDQAETYYQNNMILMAAVQVDLSKCSSLEAPGAQIQNLGDTSIAAFTALPGEEGDFTVRIGTDCFETDGILMAMIPGTLEDLEHLKDLKEAKDTWREAGDELYNSLDGAAQAVEDMRQGIEQVQQGLSSAESARETWSGAKDQILEGNDQTLDALRSVSGQLELMVPHLETAKDAAEVLHENLGDTVDILADMQKPLRKLYTRLKHLEGGTEDLSEELPQLQELMLQIVALDAQFQANEQVILTSQADLSQALELAQEEYLEDEDEDATPSQARSSKGSAYRQMEGTGLAMDQQELVTSLSQKAALLIQLAAQSKDLTDTMAGIAENTSDGAKFLKELTDSMDYLIEDVIALHDSLEVYYPDLQQALTDSSDLVALTSQALEQGVSTLTILQNTLKESSGDLDAAARDSLKGTMELLDQSLNLLDSTQSLRQAGRTMKDVIDQQLDKFDGENRFLSIDPSASKVSFTSEKNQEPNTLQIILRTQEISPEDEEHKLMDAEQETEKEGILQRIAQIFQKLWKSITGIFS